jgi:hypothetical protein
MSFEFLKHGLQIRVSLEVELEELGTQLRTINN